MLFFFFNDTATTEIYTLSLHDALPIYWLPSLWKEYNHITGQPIARPAIYVRLSIRPASGTPEERQRHRSQRQQLLSIRSEEHTSELQSRQYLVCRLLLEKKKNNISHRA